MDRQSPVVARQVEGIVLLQGEEAAQVVAAFVENEGGEETCRAAVAVVIRVYTVTNW